VSLTTSLAVYFVVWWTVLFAVLPWGVRSQLEAGEIVPGSDPGAPAVPKLASKLLWTTVVATVTFIVMDAVYTYRIVELADVAAWFGFPK
jgi:predicted secreted protein